MRVNDLLNFLELTLKFRDVYRTIKIPGKNPNENDAEHSYQLAMFAWYIATADKLNLDTNKIVKYCLVHDFAEVYAGDIDTHIATEEEKRLKPIKEEQARKRLLEEFPEFFEFHEAIIEYESKSTEEARFVYAVDKIIAEMNVYLDNNRVNVEMGLTIETIRKNKDSKVAIHPHIEKYWKEYVALHEKLEKETFKN